MTGGWEGGRREGKWKKRRRWRKLHHTTGWPAREETERKGDSYLPLGRFSTTGVRSQLPCVFYRCLSCRCPTSVSVDSSLCVLSSVVQQSDRQWDMSRSLSLTGGSRIWTWLRPAQSSSHQPSSSLSTDRVSLCSS